MKSKHLWYIPGVCAIALVLYLFQPVNGLMGHDYGHYFYRIYLGASHFWKNTLAIPYFIPNLSGGIPFHADPQADYYTLQQFLSFFLPPLFSLQFTLVLFYILGYWGFLKLTRNIFHFNECPAQITSLLFLLNGFTYAHVYVGHVMHYVFLLAPWVLVFLFQDYGKFDRRFFKALSLFSLILIYAFYGGALHILVGFAALFALIAPTLIYRKIKTGHLNQLGIFLAAASAILLLTCSGKFVAAALFSKYFYTAEIDSSGLSFWTLLQQYFWFNNDSLPPFILFGKWSYGPWEYVAFLSKLTLPGLILGSAVLLRNLNKGKGLVAASTLIVAGLILLIAQGGELNSSLPFFNHYHNPLKLLNALTVPILLLTGFAVQEGAKLALFKKSSELWRVTAFFALGGFLLAEFFMHSTFLSKNPNTLGYHYDSTYYEELKSAGGFPPIESVQLTPMDYFAVPKNATNVLSYEPLFGYRWEAVKTQLVPGPISQIRDGKYNLNHPGCFIYGKDLGCAGWDRIPASERANLALFSQGKIVPDWVPFWQKALDGLNFFGLFCLLIPFLPVVKIPSIPILRRQET